MASSVEAIAQGAADLLNTAREERPSGFALPFHAVRPKDSKQRPEEQVESGLGLVQLLPYQMNRSRRRNTIRKEPVVSLFVTHPISDRVRREHLLELVEQLCDELDSAKIDGYWPTDFETVSLYDAQAERKLQHLASLHRITYAAEFC